MSLQTQGLIQNELSDMRITIEKREDVIASITEAAGLDTVIPCNELRRLKRCLNELEETIKNNDTDSINEMPDNVCKEMLEEIKKLNAAIEISEETKLKMIQMVRLKKAGETFLEDFHNSHRLTRLYLNEVLMAVNPDKAFELSDAFSEECMKEMIA